jgi:hypothetical protein
LISGGSHEGFKEFAGFCAQWMLLQGNPTVVSKVRGNLIIASWEITSKAQVREVTTNRKIRATALAYWLGLICPTPPGLERPSSRQKEAAPQVAPEEDITGRPARRQEASGGVEAGRTPAPVRRPAQTVPTTDRVRDTAKGKWLEEVPPTEEEKEKEKEKEKKKKKRVSGEAYEYWEIGTSRDAPPSLAAEEPERPKRRRLRWATAREDGTTTISVDRNPARGPPTRTTVRIVPRVGRTQPEVTMEGDQPAAADILAEEEAMPEAEKQSATAAEGSLPEAEERSAQEREADPAAAPPNLQIPSWNLEERIPFAPQEWDADTPQIGVGAADDGVEIIDLEESEQPPGSGRTPTPIPSRDKGKATEETGTQEEERPIHHPATGDELRAHSGS